jgi:molybdopterin-binding protein
MEQSIRNELPGTIKSIVSDKVLSEVIVETSIGEIASVITTRWVQEMKLKAGDKVFALVNGATGMSDIEGKVTRVGASECGQRASFNSD